MNVRFWGWETQGKKAHVRFTWCAKMILLRQEHIEFSSVPGSWLVLRICSVFCTYCCYRNCLPAFYQYVIVTNMWALRRSESRYLIRYSQCNYLLLTWRLLCSFICRAEETSIQILFNKYLNLLCSWCSSKHFINIYLILIAYKTVTFIIPFYRGGNWDTEKSCNLPNVIQLVSN